MPPGPAVRCCDHRHGRPASYPVKPDGRAGKVKRVIDKQIPGAPHETPISIDATTGQNGLRQAKAFAEATEVSGVVPTKLDGTAMGGITPRPSSASRSS